MELFMIERYVGDSHSTESIAEKESQNLAQFLEQARGRKRLRERSCFKQEDELKVDDSTCVSEVSSKTKKIKKKENRDKKRKVSKMSIKLKNEDETKMLEEDETTLSKGGTNNECTEANTLDLDNDSKPLKKNDTDSVRDNISKEPKSENAFEELEPQIEMTVIGRDDKKEKPNAVRRMLPKWLANPYFFSSDVNKNLIAVAEMKDLHSDLVSKLEKHGVQHFFPVQRSLIPAVLSSWEKNSPVGRGGFLPQDICVCAPTGSGKTLAYVLPVIELLRNTTLRRLEALVIVPTKDLATQVWNVFNMYVQGTGLTVGLANGLKSLQKEQQQLGSNSSLGYSSYVNILVATPGRLVEHISTTGGFSLLFLRFFIIDEADRLLAEPYFGWLDKVYGSVFSSSASKEARRLPVNTLTPFWSGKIERPLQKLLFSATLTQNPEKLATLRLYKPKFYTVSKPQNYKGCNEEVNIDEANEEFDTLMITPSTLKESMYICNSGGKPLVLLHLLTELGLDGVLCFTSSLESTHRLFLLVKHFGEIGVQEFSSNLSAARRQTILNDFKCGQTRIIICSDAMARGLDVPAVKYVISYDPPVSSKTYVHRVGRTARAGKTGTAITLLHDNEVFHFKKMLKSLNKDKISKHSVKDDALESLMERYETALEELKVDMTSSKKQIKRNKRR